MNIVFLLLYFALIFVSTLFIRHVQTKDDFLVANRNVGTIPMAMSIASTWIWAPALFVSAEQSFLNGWQGLFWFTVPNVLCLLLFIPFAVRLRKLMPNGYTLSEYMGYRYSKRVKGIYLFQLTSLSLLSTVVQLLAGGKIVSLLTGIPFWLTTLILGSFAYAYSKTRGIKASILTDIIQLIIIIGSLAILVPWILKGAGTDSLVKGLIGVNGDSLKLFEGNALTLFLSFGIPTTIGLLSGPFGDQNFWQRALSVREEQIVKSFALAAILFAAVPIMMGSLGFIASGIGLRVEDSSIVNLELIKHLLPSWTSVVFIFVILSGLLSTINSNLSSMSSLANDMIKNASIKDLRSSMLVLVTVAVILSNIPVTIIDFFLIYGTLRATTFSTTVLTLTGLRLSERGVFYGIIGSLLLGLPTFIYGSLTGNVAIKLTGSISALALSGIIAILITRVGGRIDTTKENVS